MTAKRQELIKGIAVSPGIVRAPAFVVGAEASLNAPRHPIAETDVGAELAKFEAALRDAEATLRTLRAEVRTKIGPAEAEIFDAQIMMLRDPSFLSEVSIHVSTDRLNVEAVVADVVERFTQMFSDIADPLLRERAGDVRDVGRRVLGCLLQQQPAEPHGFPAGVILVAPELSPSTTARLDLRGVRAVVTERGGKTSHAAILMRSLRLPAVVAAKDATRRIQSGDPLILDGMSGAIFIHPRDSVVEEYARLEAQFRVQETALEAYIDRPAQTADGVPIRLLANIGKSADSEAAVLFRAEGIGLFRTEFGFLVRDQFPTVEEHLDIYACLAERMHPREVVIRVVDIGSDKTPEYFQLAREENPSLGLRGTRLLLRHPEVLEAQLRAILRVSADHPVSVLFPGIAGVEEIAGAKEILEREKDRLRREGIAFNSNLRVGAMIELPSAVMRVERILREVDFLSLGTNDLTQYLLAADRSSPEMAEYHRAIHPAVLHAIKRVIDCGRAVGKDVTICGAMAGNPERTALLVGLGARILSVTPGEILEIKRALGSLTLPEAGLLADGVLELDTVREIEERVQATLAPAPARGSRENAATGAPTTG
jgi:phosphotransferase system enzyme I (PtsI)